MSFIHCLAAVIIFALTIFFVMALVAFWQNAREKKTVKKEFGFLLFNLAICIVLVNCSYKLFMYIVTH